MPLHLQRATVPKSNAATNYRAIALRFEILCYFVRFARLTAESQLQKPDKLVHQVHKADIVPVRWFALFGVHLCLSCFESRGHEILRGDKANNQSILAMAGAGEEQ